MKNIREIIRNLYQDYLNRQRTGKIEKHTRKLRKIRESDYARWSKANELFVEWDERTAIIASMIKPGSRVIEFGAGNMALKEMLPANCEYAPSDIVVRTPYFIKCDLNQTISFNLSSYDTAVFSGVLEYVYNVDFVFEQLSDHIQNVILSYSCRDISAENRLKNGWLSDYSRMELEQIFHNHNFKIFQYREWKNQSVFSLQKNAEN